MSKLDAATRYIYYNKADKWTAWVIGMGHRCHQTHLCAAWKGRQMLGKTQSLIVICFVIVFTATIVLSEQPGLTLLS